jgi:hypothetical protein
MRKNTPLNKDQENEKQKITGNIKTGPTTPYHSNIKICFNSNNTQVEDTYVTLTEEDRKELIIKPTPMRIRVRPKDLKKGKAMHEQIISSPTNIGWPLP